MTLGVKSSNVDGNGETMIEDFDFGKIEDEAWNRRFAIDSGLDDTLD